MPFSFEDLDLPGVVIIQPQRFEDERGAFMETFRRSDFHAGGITEDFVQSNVSWSKKGVLRGIHYQEEPYAQGKLVRVIEGEIHDVVVDLRKGSADFGRWRDVLLTAENRTMLYIPPGYGHGFCVLSDTAQVSYDLTQEYAPDAERGVLWSDPILGIPWPVVNPIVSAKDQAWPLLAAVPR